MVFEVVEREVKPKFEALRNSIDIGTGTLK
jgi:hypothetical protein